ncbi:MAG TPA: outer membrane protein assembly factor BamD [Magnetococcales bacterium]|nr:outer membrane protein assembly factor BamD [Magnetococcales bacterium]
MRNMMIQWRCWLVAGLWVVLLAGCSSTDGVKEKFSAEQLYGDGVKALKLGSFGLAAEKFQDVDRQHPFSALATPSQLNLIYVHYRKEDYEEAIAAAERFIRLHPRHKSVAYAYYMRGLSFYQRISDAFRDQQRSRDALVAFREVVSRFPDSDYAWQSKRMINVCKDRMAEQEMVVARYYLEREEYIAANNRFQRVIQDTDFSTTIYVEEALFSMVLTSLRLGLREEAVNHTVVLGRNFSNGLFFKKAVAMVEKGEDVTRWELASLRKGVEEGSFLMRFVKGLAPAMVSGGESL